MRARQLKHEDDDDDDVGAQPLAATASHQLQKNDKAPVQTETLIISQNKLKKKQLATEIDHDEPFLARRDRPQEPVTKKKKRSKKNKKNEETLLQNQQRPCLLTLATAQHWEDSGVVETPNLLAQICKRSSENSLDEDHDGSSFLSADTGSVTRPGAIRIQGASIESSSSSGSDEGAVQQVVSNDQISSNTQRLVEAELAPDITLVEAQTAPDVDEVVDQAVNQAVQQMDERLKARKKRLIAFCVASIVIIAALVAALVVAKRDITAPGEVMTTPPSFNASATTNNPTSPPPTIKPTEDIDTKMLRIIGGIYPGEFPSTNDQEDALEWLSLDDKVAMLVNTEASNHHYLAVQRYCLALLFYMTDGLHWVRKYLWLSSQDVCDWEMLSCDDDQQVIRMSISNNGLYGPMPTELGLLSQLTCLDLNSNDLTGTIPSSLGQLTALTALWLSKNQFTGTIPSSLGQLTRLSSLYLNENQLTGTAPLAINNLNIDFAYYGNDLE